MNKNKTKKPLISAIVSIYNSEQFIRGKLDDLLSQTILDELEIILINSGSQQNEDSIINDYLLRHKNIIYLKTENRETIYKAWNRAIKLSSGKYITNSNTDDRLKNDALEILASDLEKNPDVFFVFANQYKSYIPNEKYEDVVNKKTWIIPEFDYLIQLDRCVVLSQPMWRRALHDEDNLWFNENYEICGDHDFVLRIFQKHKIKYLSFSLGTFYIDKNRSNKSLRDLKFLEKEKTEMTSGYILNYIDKMDDELLSRLEKLFKNKVKLPIPLLRALNIVKKYLIPQKHQFTHEFVFYIYTLICIRKGQLDKAEYYCDKLLRRKDSNRMLILRQRIDELKNHAG